MHNTKTIFVTISNTDLTEGGGNTIPIAVSECEITAERLGIREYVQGSNCRVEKMEMIEIEGKWYVPVAAANIVRPSKEDRIAQEKLDMRRAAITRAKAAGLTEEDIKLLTI